MVERPMMSSVGYQVHAHMPQYDQMGVGNGGTKVVLLCTPPPPDRQRTLHGVT